MLLTEQRKKLTGLIAQQGQLVEGRTRVSRSHTLRCL
jgi:hypothetical protein